MMSKINRRRSQKGFTLIELLIVVAIIGIIAAMLIPNLIEALQKAKQKRTMADERNIGTAMFEWYTDMVGAAAAGGSVTPETIAWDDVDPRDHSVVVSILVQGGAGGILPEYIQTVPKQDGWGSDYEFAIDDNLLNDNVLGIRSPGKPGQGEDVGTFEFTDYDKGAYLSFRASCDIVWIDGEFVFYPAGKKFVDAQGFEAGNGGC